ncbi:MAG: ferritin-like domain-containing protein [Myxococcota bacterium]
MNEPFIDEEPEERNRRRMANTALTLALLPVLAFVGFPIAIAVGGAEAFEVVSWIWLASCALAVVGIVQGIRAYRRGEMRGLYAALIGFFAPPITLFLSLFFIPFTRGRAFRRRGKAQLPTSTENEHWRTAPQPIVIEASARDGVADAWRVMAATEAASIAAFSSLSQQLLAVGAPSEFLEMAHRDALDEIDHARRCYEIARAVDGREVGAAPFPPALLPGPQTITLLSLARECLKESCVLEGASARAAEELSAVAQTPFRDVLKTIAADEARHAAHGWAMLAWLVAQGVDPASLAGVLSDLRKERFAAIVEDARWERYGVASSAHWHAAVHASIDDAAQRLRSLSFAA